MHCIYGSKRCDTSTFYRKTLGIVPKIDRLALTYNHQQGKKNKTDENIFTMFCKNCNKFTQRFVHRRSYRMSKCDQNAAVNFIDKNVREMDRWNIY